MRLPRGVSGARVIRALEKVGYSAVRQKGSHVRLYSAAPVAHHVTIPLHDQIKPGTLHVIVAEVARVKGFSIEFLIDLL